MRVLVTGSEGLVGRFLCAQLRSIGWNVKTFDVRSSQAEDVRSIDAIKGAVEDVDGVVHLAAVSRVVWAETEPEKCWEVNVRSLARLISVMAGRPKTSPPWLLFASSREVYGQQLRMPVPESTRLQPMNIYARSKVEGELIALGARSSEFKVNVVRLSSVYGSTGDHPTRVVPAFARAAAVGGEIRIEGQDNVFDFVHIKDVVRGLIRLIELTSQGFEFDPIHLCSGHGTSLATLGALAASLSNKKVNLRITEPRDFDVGKFIGCVARSKEVLDWQSKTPLEVGFAELVGEFRSHSI